MKQDEKIKDSRLALEQAISANDRELVYEKAELLESILNAEEIVMSEEWMNAFFYLISFYPRLYEKDNLEVWMDDLIAFFKEKPSPYITSFTLYSSQTAWFFFENDFGSKSKLLCRASERLLETILAKTDSLDEEGHIQVFQSITNITDVFRHQENYEKTIYWNEQGTTLAEYFLDTNKELYLDAINILANVYYYINHFDRAVLLLYSTLKNKECGVHNLHDKTSVLVNNLAQNFEQLNDYNKSVQVYSNLLDFYNEYPLQCRSTILRLTYDISNQYVKFGFPESALPFQESVVNGWRGDADFPRNDFAVVLASYGNNLMTLGQFDKAEKIIREVLAIRGETDGEQSTPYARSLCAMANLYNASRRFDTALEMALRAKEILSMDSENSLLVIDANVPIANSLQAQKEYHRAEDIIKESIQLIKESNDKSLLLQEAFQHSELASLYEKQGKLEESVEEDLNALQIFRDNYTKSNFGYGRFISKPINTLKTLQRFDEAEVLSDEVIEFLNGQNAAREALVPFLQSKAECQIHKGNLKGAEHLLKECLTILEEGKGSKSKEYVDALISLVTIYLQNDLLNEAYALATQAMDLAVKVYSPSSLNTIVLKSHYGKILFRLEKQEDSYNVYRGLIKIAADLNENDMVQYGGLLYQVAIDCHHEGNYRSSLLLLKHLEEIKDSFLNKDDPKRKIISDAILKLENQLNTSVPDGFIPLSDSEFKDDPEHRDFNVQAKCLSAFFREDYHLCLRLGREDYYGMETSFLVLLSYLFLGMQEEASEYGQILESATQEDPYISNLCRLILGKENIEDCLTVAMNNRERGAFYMYSGTSLVALGNVEEGVDRLKKALTYEEDQEKPFIESIIANQVLYNLENKDHGDKPAVITSNLNSLYSSLSGLEEAGEIDEYLKISLEIRDIASQLGKEHPSYGDALINLARSNILKKKHEDAHSLLRRGLNVLFSFFPAGHSELEKCIAEQYSYFSGWSDDALTRADNNYLYSRKLLILFEKDKNFDIFIALTVNILGLISSEYYQELLDEFQAVSKGFPDLETLSGLSTSLLSFEMAVEKNYSDRYLSMAHFIEAQKLIKIGRYQDALVHVKNVIKYNQSGLEQAWAEQQKAYLEEQLDSTKKDISTSSLVEELEIAFAFLEKGLVEKACKAAKSIELKVKGDKAADLTVASKVYYELGIIYKQCSLLDEAIAIYELAIKKFDRENYYYAWYKMGLGSSYLAKKEYEKAQYLLEDAYKLFSEKNTRVSIGYKDLLFSLVTLYMSPEIFNLDIAEKYCQELIDTIRRLMGEVSADYSNAVLILSQIYFMQRKKDRALEVARKAYDLTVQNFGKSGILAIDAAIALARISFTVVAEEGEKYLDECVKMIFEYYSLEDMHFIHWLFDALSVYYDNCKYQKTIDLSENLLQIMKEDEEKFANEVFRCLKYIADAYHGLGRYSDALEYRKQNLELASGLYSEESMEYAFNAEMLALTYEAMGEKEAAESLYNKALNIIYKVQL